MSAISPNLSVPITKLPDDSNAGDANNFNNLDNTIKDSSDTQYVDGAGGITNPNANLARVNTPDPTATSNNEIGPKRELQFSQAGRSNSVRNNAADIIASKVTLGPYSDFGAMQRISEQRTAINAAGKAHKVAPEAIAGIMYQELATKGADDVKQDEFAKKIATTTLPNSPERTNLVNKANEDPNVSPLRVNGIGKPKSDITRNVTLGDAQLSVDGVVGLFGGKWDDKTKQYLQKDGAKSYLPEVMSQSNFFKDPVGNSMKILTDSSKTPNLVGAWAERQISVRTGQIPGYKTMPVTNIELNGPKNLQYPDFSQSKKDMHYVYLTGTYSSDGNFYSTAGNQWGRAYGASSLDRQLTSDPLKYTSFDSGNGPSPGATAALNRRQEINQLLNGAKPENIRVPTPQPGVTYPR